MKMNATSVRNAIIAVLAIAAPVAWADTYYVATNGDDGAAGGETTPFATIAKGVAMATASSAPRKVIVRTGTYKIDAVITISEELTIESETGRPADVVIDGQGVTPLVKWTKARAATLSGLTLTNGYWCATDKDSAKKESAGVALAGGTVTNCVIAGCCLTGAGTITVFGAGINAESTSTLTARIINTCVVGNVVSNSCQGNPQDSVLVGGGGIWLNSSYRTVVSGCIVEGNCVWHYQETTSTYNPGNMCRGGGIGMISSASSEIRDSIIRNNLATNACSDGCAGQGGGLFAYGSTTVVSNCLVYGNMASAKGGGIAADSGASIVRCTITNNTVMAVKPRAVQVYGAGVWLINGSKCVNSRVEGNQLLGFTDTFIGNTSEGGGGGIALGGASQNTTDPNLVANCSVANNSAHLGGAFFALYANDSVISNCLVRDNSAGSGGAVGYWAANHVLVTDCVMAYNTVTGNGAIGYSYKNATANCGGIVFRNSFLYGNRTTGSSTCGLFRGRFDGGITQPLVIDHCTIVSNSARNYFVELHQPDQATNVFLIGNVFFRNTKYNGTTLLPMSAPAELAATTNTCYNFSDTDSGLNPDPVYGNCATLTANYFADADSADYRLRMGGAAQDKGGPVEGWMGTGRKNGQLDMGDGTMTVVSDGGYGVNIVRNNAVPRVKGTPEPGCFELWWPLGFILSIQ